MVAAKLVCVQTELEPRQSGSRVQLVCVPIILVDPFNPVLVAGS